MSQYSLFSNEEDFMSELILQKAASREEKRAYWHHHVTSCRESGFTQMEYCKKEKINFQRFCWWKGKILKESSHLSEVQSFSFVPLKIKPITSSKLESELTFHLPNQVKISLPSGTDFEQLVLIVKALGRL